jgi:glucuronosyltransferase
MPKHLWEEFIRTFESVDHLRFVWQTNSGVDELIGHRQMPKNVILLKWAPVKILLAHPNLHYAILHGGINTINELLFFGIPALGIPLQVSFRSHSS